MSGSERVIEHGVENGVLQRVEIGGNRGKGFDKIYRIGAERRKTAAGSPKGERSESMNRILGIGEKAFDLA